MALEFDRGQQLGATDLNIIIRDAFGVKVDPFEITFTLFDRSSGIPVPVGLENRIPTRIALGEFFIEDVIPTDANLGDWEARYFLRETDASPLRTVIIDFRVRSPGTPVVGFLARLSEREREMCRRLRVMLRDNNPDRNYRFRPPLREAVIQNFTERIGFIWEDEELFTYLTIGLDATNLSPPKTFFSSIDLLPEEWSTVVLTAAAMYAVMALTLNWIADEFSYSIGGISLDLSKSEKYASARDAFKDMFADQREQAKLTVRHTRGLQQRLMGSGGIFHLGPFSRSGVINVRNFL